MHERTNDLYQLFSILHWLDHYYSALLSYLLYSILLNHACMQSAEFTDRIGQDWIGFIGFGKSLTLMSSVCLERASTQVHFFNGYYYNGGKDKKSRSSFLG